MRRMLRGAEPILAVLGFALALAVLLGAQLGRGDPAERDCQTNNKQVALAMIMYANDYNDRFPMPNYRGLTHPEWGNLQGEDPDLPWPRLTYPYSKSGDVYRCPADPLGDSIEAYVLDPRTGGPLPDEADTYVRRAAWGFRTNRGYNHVWLAPEVIETGKPVVHPLRQTDAGTPAATILFLDSAWSRDRDGKPVGGGRFIVDAPLRHTARVWGKLPASKEGPGGWLCYVYGQGDPNSEYCKSNEQAYGYVYPFHKDGTGVVTAFLDGHVKTVTMRELLAGTDPAKQTITDPRDCLWDTIE
jgi:hypothetical protein